MKSIGVALLVALLALSVGVTASYAHHAFGAIYESSKQVAFDQVKIVSVAWTNPHTRIAFDVTEENGDLTRWDTETGSPSALSRMGWLRNAVKPGDVINVAVQPALDGTNRGHLFRVVLPDGTEFNRRGALR
jgi:hypothetical protein